MVGVVVDAYRMRVTKAEWTELLDVLSAIAGRTLEEFHAKRFYSGSGIWGDIPGAVRSDIITELLQWFTERGHHVVNSAVEKAKFAENFDKHAFSQDIGSLWRLLGFHVVLALQKHHQREKKNKGNTVLVFDEQVMEKELFLRLLLNPPEWSETYYDRRDDQEALDQIVNVPHFVDSKHVLLIQVADLITFLLRRHLELKAGGYAERYEGERQQIQQWASMIFDRTIGMSAVYPRRGLCDAAQYFQAFAPECVLGV